MNVVFKAILINVFFLLCFTLIYKKYDIAPLVIYYMLGIVCVCTSWILPFRIKMKTFPAIKKMQIKPYIAILIFFVFSIFIAKVRGINIFDLLSVFTDRESFVDTQEGMGIVFIAYFEIFFGFWLANFFLEKISIFHLFLIVLIFTLLSFSRAYFFYLLVAYVVRMQFNLKNTTIVVLFFLFSCSLLLLRFNTTDINVLLDNPVVVELFTKYPFVGIARLGIEENLPISYYNYFTGLIMPYDFLSFGTVENILHMEKGYFSYSRHVGEALGEFKELPILSSGELSSFNAFGTLFFPFKFFSNLSLIYLFLISFINAIVFRLARVKMEQAYRVLAFLLVAGILISLFSTLLLIGILLGYCFSLKIQNDSKSI